MEFLSTTWSLLRERPRALVVGSKHKGSKDNAPSPLSLSTEQTHIVPYPSKMIGADLSTVSLAPTTSQWSPVSMTFDQKPHLLVKRSKSLKSSFSRRSKFHSADRMNVPKHPSPLGLESSLPSNDRKSNLLDVVIVPLTRRKSKTSIHKAGNASPTPSEASSLSSQTSKKEHFHFSSLRRTASQTSVRHPREYRDFDRSKPVPPLPHHLVPPVPDLPPGVVTRHGNGEKLQPRRPKTAEPDSTLHQHPLPTRPIIADVEGYWDHLDLLNVNRGRDPPFPLPRQPHHHSPIPF